MCFTSGDVKGVAGRNRRREFDNNAVGARSSRGSREAVDSCSPEVRGSGGQGRQPRARAGGATGSALSGAAQVVFHLGSANIRSLLTTGSGVSGLHLDDSVPSEFMAFRWRLRSL